MKWWLIGVVAVAGAWLLLTDWTHGSPYPEHRVAGGDPDSGKVLLYQWACGSCHVIPGVMGASGRVGPPLTDWAARQYIAGKLWNRPEDLVAWIVDPREIEPGTAMPDLGVPPEVARHMAAYLYTVGDGNPLGPPHPFPIRWLEKIGKVRRVGPNQ